MKSATPLALALLFSGLTLSRAADGNFRIIALTGTMAPALGGNFSGFDAPVLNGSGGIALIGRSGTNEGIFLTAGTSLVNVVTSGQQADVIGGTFNDFSDLLLNEKGTIAFRAQNPTLSQGLYTVSGGTITTVAATGVAGQNFTVFPSALSLSDTGSLAFRADTIVSGVNLGNGLYSGSGGPVNVSALATNTQLAPGTSGTLSTLSAPVFNNVGVAAFSNRPEQGSGIYTSVGSWKMTIATTLMAAPVIGGNFLSFTANLAINDKGTVAFQARNNETGFGKSGIFSGSGGAISAIATSVTTVPVLGGTFSIFSDPTLNNAGTVAFKARSSLAGRGIFTGNGGALQAVALTTQMRPNGTGLFTDFGNPVLNNGGTAAFLGTSSDGNGIYLGDGQQLITAASKGQSVGGSTIASVNFAGGADRGGASQFNDNGQVAYTANLTNGTIGVFLFTPTLHYRTATSGTWGARSNWTVSLLPAAVHDVFIDPNAPLTVTGPAVATKVKSLTINGTGAGTATLALQNYGSITATDGVTSGPAGALTGNGRINGHLSNAGSIAPGQPAAAGGISVFGNVTLQPTSHLTLDLGGLIKKTSYDFLNVGGSFTLGGALDVSLLGGFVPQVGNTFDLFDAASTTGTFSSLNLPSLTGGLTWNTSLLATSGILSVGFNGPVTTSWNSSGGGSWATAGNWSSGSVPNAIGARATFGAVPPAGGAPTLVTVNGPKTVGAIVFDHADGYQITGLAGDLITLNNDSGTPSISALAGNHTLAAPLALAQDTSASTAAGTTLTLSGAISGNQKLTKTGAGTLNLDGDQNYATLDANAGTTNVQGTFTGGTATVNANATLNFETSQTLGALNIGTAAAPFAAEMPLLSGSEVVPEPGTFSLLALSALGVLAHRRRSPR